MFNDRPLLQKAAYGGGAFAFVFTAAMAGTALMISGGVLPSFGDPASERPYQRAAWLEPGYISDAPPVADTPWTRVDESRPIQYAEGAEPQQIAYTATDAAYSDFDNGLLEAYTEPMEIRNDSGAAPSSYEEPQLLEGEVLITPKDQLDETPPARVSQGEADDLFAESDGGAFPSF